MTPTTSFISSPQSEKLWRDPLPMWLWDVDRQRIVWANKACLLFSGVSSINDLLRLKFSKDAPFIKQLAVMSMYKTELEGVRELIRFPARDGEFVFDCLCKNKEIEVGRVGVLVALIADKGKITSAPDKSPANGVLKNSQNSQNGLLNARKKEPLRPAPAPAPAPVQVVQNEPVATEPVQILSFDVERQINGFQIEAEKVDEEDLLTLREIARMINGPIGLGAGRVGGGRTEVSAQQSATVDRRPLIATRAHDVPPGAEPKQNIPAGRPKLQIVEATSQSDVPEPALHQQGSTAPSNQRSGRSSGTGMSERNYFLESLPAALAIAMGGRLMRANEAFLYAFGFGSESELRKAGGLAALFPQSQNGVLIADLPSASSPSSSQKSSRSARLKTLAITRSGRRRQIFVAFRNVSTGREPVQILILHEDAFWQDEDTSAAEDFASEERGGEDQLSAEQGHSIEGQDENTGQDSIDFLATVSHEVRTPLNSIIGFSELMKDERFGAVDGDRFRGYASDIHTSAMHALSLINDLLDITKIMAGKADLDFEPVKSVEVIREAVSAMRAQAKAKGIHLQTSLRDGLPALLADRRSLKQILLNLLSNAIKFTPEGGEVRVSAQQGPDKSILLIISDSGIGMRKDQINMAMEPFAQLESGQKDHSLHETEKGTGLGLPLTKALVKAHHARFSIDSIPGHGTSVEISFPKGRLAR